MYRVFCDNCKIHWCIEASLSLLVAKDLETRFKDNAVISFIKNDDEFIYDPGGTLIRGNEQFCWKIKNGLQTINIKCRKQHYNTLRGIVIDLNFSENDKDFYKLHGYLHTLCLSKEHFKELYEQIVKEV